jgi:hypothetical protein
MRSPRARCESCGSRGCRHATAACCFFAVPKVCFLLCTLCFCGGAVVCVNSCMCVCMRVRVWTRACVRARSTMRAYNSVCVCVCVCVGGGGCAQATADGVVPLTRAGRGGPTPVVFAINLHAGVRCVGSAPVVAADGSVDFAPPAHVTDARFVVSFDGERAFHLYAASTLPAAAVADPAAAADVPFWRGFEGEAAAAAATTTRLRVLNYNLWNTNPPHWVSRCGIGRDFCCVW